MADEKTYTQEQLDAAVAKAVDGIDVDGLKSKIDELIGDNKKLKTDLRKTQDIKPEDVAALEAELDAAKAKLTEATKAATEATRARDKAVKDLEAETGASRNYALERDISEAVAAAGIIPAAVPQYAAWLKTQDAKVEVVDGKMVTTIGGKAPKDFVTEHVGTDDGKTFKAAANNSGGDASGGSKGNAGKSIAKSDFDKLSPKDRAAKMAEGYTLNEAA